MLNVGIVGFGKMGMLHGALLSATRQTKIVAICDKSFVMRWGFKKVYKGVRTYKDIDKMLAVEKLDAVVISTPTFNHKVSALKALQKGCSVFIEKPLAITEREAMEISVEAQKRKLNVQVGFCNRFAGSISLAKEKLRQNILGDIKNVQAKMYIGDVFEPHTGWRYKKECSGGGALMDFGIHMVDLLVWYFGPINELKAEAKKIYSLEVEDEVTSEIMFGTGVICNFETSWSKDEYRKSYTNIKITGTEGSMEVTDQTLDIYDVNGIKKEGYTYPELYNGSFIDIGGLLYSDQMEAFLLSTQGLETKACTAQEAQYVQKIIECMYESSKLGNTVKVRGM